MYSDEQLHGGPAAEEETRDLIEAVDEDGNSVLLEVVRYFFYNGEEYVAMTDAEEDDCDCEECHHHHEEDDDAMNIYIMKVVEGEEDGEEYEEFIPVADEELLEKLVKVVEADFRADVAFDDE